MKSVMKRYLVVLTVAVSLLALLVFGVMLTPNVEAAPSNAPMAIVTPVASINSSAQQPGILPWIQSEVVVTSTAFGSDRLNIESFELVDLHYVVDQGTTNNVTITLQFSNDGVNWVAGPAVLTNSSTDQNDIKQFALFGRYARLNVDATNTNPLTMTLIGVGK